MAAERECPLAVDEDAQAEGLVREGDELRGGGSGGGKGVQVEWLRRRRL